MSSLPPALDFAAMEMDIVSKWKQEESFATQDRLSLERDEKVGGKLTLGKMLPRCHCSLSLSLTHTHTGNHLLVNCPLRRFLFVPSRLFACPLPRPVLCPTQKFTFYDGPPFATGLPHYGHILAGTIKDTVTRYAAMTGHYVQRRAGWDCHGLPVEYEIDQKLNITHRDQVLEMGIDKYNATCRSIVTRYTSEWESTVTRLGRWIDFRNDYKTMDPTFMESVWWVFRQLFDKGLVYQGYKVMPYSTGCTTPLSNFEAGLNYKDVKDPAVVVSFPIKGQDNVHFVAWTTTPWTLPSNLALCVNPNLDYVRVLDKATGKRYVLAQTRLVQLYPKIGSKKWKPENAKDLYEIEETFKGTALVGQQYEPLFDFFADKSPEFFRVVSDTYVTDDAGTGVVHQAPAFGEDDYRVCLANNIIVKGGDIPCPVDANGEFTDEVPFCKGIHVKKADDLIIPLLKEAGRLVQKDVLLHSYPFCWRSDTPLIYKAVPSWFVKVEQIRDQVVENNKATYWVPKEVKEGRFHNWLSDARDWAVSRNRFWGTPIPIWANEDLTEVLCIGSIDELAELSGVRVDDLHRETVDKVEIPSKKSPGTTLKRVEEVFDCWFESGSMPYAQSHYPFENKDRWEKGFPADFIAEGLDQTRGWFYTLMILSTALFNKPAFKNNIVNGMVLAEDGQKMSKRKKNYPDPNLVISRYGADALRMYLVNSPVVRAESLKFREDGVLGVVKEVFLPWYNAFRFFLQNIERWEKNGRKFSPDTSVAKSSSNPTDIWIQAETQGLIKFVHEEMRAYRLYTVMPVLVKFITQLTNWYVRLNRDRLKGMEGDGDEADKEAEVGLHVLYDVLMDVTVLMGPFTPFITEFFYQHLRKFQPSYAQAADGGGSSNPVMRGKSDSVHFLPLPSYDESRLNTNAVESMEVLQSVVELGRNAREKRNISLRTPVKMITAVLSNPSPHVVEGITGPLKSYILSELNAWDFYVVPKEEEHDWVKLRLTPDFSKLGKKLGPKMKAVKAHVVNLSHEDAVAALAKGTMEIEDAVIDCASELDSKLDFAKEGDHWEAAVKADGSLVVAVDCTQDEATISSGMSREVISAVQQLRKAAGLDLSDTVEAFFEEEAGVSLVESAVSKNVPLFEAKMHGLVPLPQHCAPSWSVVLKSDYFDIGQSRTKVTICRQAMAVSDTLAEPCRNVVATLDPSSFVPGQDLKISVDGSDYTLKEGADFFLNSTAKARGTKSFDWC
jgi:isoleucyl-tRNA synthetase